MFEVLMHVVGYSSIYKRLEMHAIFCGKIFEGKHRSREMHKEVGLRLPCGTADSRDQQAAVVDPRLPILPKQKQYNKTEINNHDHIMICTSK